MNELSQRTGLLTAVTLAAFAANSVLCRMALGDGLIDPIAFTTIRVRPRVLSPAP